MKQIEVWIMTDADGDYAAGMDAMTVAEAFEDEIGAPKHPVRMDRLKVNIELPVIHEVSLDLPLAVAGEIQVESADARIMEQ